MRHLGKVSSVLVLVLAACGPMYGAKSQKLRDPAPVPRPKTLPADDAVATKPPPDIEDCDYRWPAATAPAPKQPKPPSPRAQAAEKLGDTKLGELDREPSPAKKGPLLLDGIDAYGRALADDPYNGEYTLKLALAYDKAHRKGCAIALLQRLAKLSDHPTYKATVRPLVDEVVDKKQYFSRYRNEAVRAVGR